MLLINTDTPISNPRIERNKVLYDATICLVTIARDVKDHVNSVFHGTSPLYKQVS